MCDVCPSCMDYVDDNFIICKNCCHQACLDTQCCVYSKCEIYNCRDMECYILHRYICKNCNYKINAKKEIEKLKKTNSMLKKTNSKLKSLILYCSTNINKEIVKKIYNFF
jgi:hypothetical protein